MNNCIRVWSRYKFRSYKFPITSFVHPKVRVNANLKIGECCSIMAGNEFRGGKINIGDRVVVGPSCLFMTDNHAFGRNAKGYSPYGVEVVSKEIIIAGDVWIGSNAIFTPGTYIGRNCIIAAGSVLFGEYPENCIIKGNPARVVNELVVSDHNMPITEVRTLKLNPIHLFMNLKRYSQMSVHDVDVSQSFQKKYVFWANKLVNGD